jgi:uncharacterized protein (TIGR03083 family)
MTETSTQTLEVLPVAYRAVRRHIGELLAEPFQPGLAVPHCPEWSVEDVVEHLVEVCARVKAREAGTEPDPLTAHGVNELLSEWEELSPPVEAYLAEPWTVQRGKLVMDAFTHEVDLRHAIGAPPPSADHPALQVATTVAMLGLTFSLREHGMAALGFTTELGQWTAGDGEPVARTTNTWHEVYLSVTGRRSAAELEDLGWSGDIRPFVPAFTWGPFTVPQR